MSNQGSTDTTVDSQEENAIPIIEDAADTKESTAYVRKQNWFRSWGMPVLSLLILGSGLIWVRLFFNPVMGQAVVNFVTVGVGGILVINLVSWFVFLSYYSRRFIWSIMLPLMFVSVAWAGSIKQIDFDGDMNMTFTYRWEKPAELQTVIAEEDADQQIDYSGDFAWQQYRGPNRDGIIPGPPLSNDWSTKPPKKLWQTNVGAGYAAISVSGNSLVTIEQREDQEAITCYHRSSGKLKWIHQYPSRFYEAMGGLGPRTTPTILGNRVYTFGATGVACCLDLETGEQIWIRDLLNELEIPNITWGISASPLILGDKLILNPGGATGNGLMAINRETGETIWTGEGVDQYSEVMVTNWAGYSSPMMMTIHGHELLVIFDGIGLSAHDPETGKQLFLFEHKNSPGVNVAQPVLLEDGEHIFISASYGMGSALMKVSCEEIPSDDEQAVQSNVLSAKWNVEQVWQDSKVMRSKYSNVIYHDGSIYGLDEGIMMCLDPMTGKKHWKSGRYGHGQFIMNGDVFLVLAENGTFHMVAVDPDKHRTITSFPALPETSRVWNPFAISDGILYVRDHETMIAYDLK